MGDCGAKSGGAACHAGEVAGSGAAPSPRSGAARAGAEGPAGTEGRDVSKEWEAVIGGAIGGAAAEPILPTTLSAAVPGAVTDEPLGAPRVALGVGR
ncbi:MAG: hypothetical protein FJ295_13270 [Planctomycetes bacterium]|nr:hypothetical protein [Planctomycetota bacterium]